MMPALLIGSISTLADTSELQRSAFNGAFAEHGLDWHWDRETYRAMLETAGGAARIAAHASGLGVDVDAAAVHATKSRLFRERLAGAGIEPRPGVVDVIAAARAADNPVGLVTTTSKANVEALLGALAPAVSPDSFDVVITAEDVATPKPHPDAYEAALARLGIQPADALAVEDNVDGVAAATAAGMRCVAFPNANTIGHDFSEAVTVAERLEASVLA